MSFEELKNHAEETKKDNNKLTQVSVDKPQIFTEETDSPADTIEEYRNKLLEQDDRHSRNGGLKPEDASEFKQAPIIDEETPIQ